MSWTIEYNEIDGFIRIRSDGVMDIMEIREMSADASRARKKYGVAYALADHRRMAPEVTTADIVWLSKELKELGHDANDQRTAIIAQYDQTSADDFSFFSYLSRVEGLNINLFRDESQAINWLKMEKMKLDRAQRQSPVRSNGTPAACRGA